MSPTVKKALIAGLVVCVAVILWRWHSGDDGEEISEKDETTESEASGSDDVPAASDRKPSLFDRFRGRLGSVRKTEDLASVVGSGRVEGVVLDADSGASLGNVDVLFRRGAGEESATADDGGRFSVELLAGRYQVRAIGDRLLGLPAPDIRVVKDESLTIEVRVRRLATISGRVVNYAGGAISGAAVRFVAKTPGEKALQKSGLLLTEVPSESDGSFELEVLPQKQLSLEAKRGYLARTVILKDLAAGERRTGVEIELERGATVRGVVVGPSGGAMAGANVSLVRPSDKKGQLVAADEAGRFEFEPMAPGPVILEAASKGLARSVPSRLTLAPGGNADVSLSLQAPRSIRGTVTDSEGNGVANVKIRCGRQNSKMGAYTAWTDTNGVFEVPGLDGGKHWISAARPGYATITKERVRPPTDLDFKLLGLGAISGTVVGATGAPLTDFVVEIISVTPRGVSKPKAVGKSTRFREQTGVYTLEELDPGRYQLAVKGAGKESRIQVDVPPETTARGDVALK